MDSRHRKAVVVLLLQALESLETEAEAVADVVNNDTSVTAMAFGAAERRHGASGRSWQHVRNDPEWFFNYALQPSFIASGSWQALFRVSSTVFTKLLSRLHHRIRKQTTNFRQPLKPELRLASFRMYSGGASCDAVAAQLGIIKSSVDRDVKVICREICTVFGDQVALPQEEEHIAAVMKGFQDIRGLPYCVGAIDGTHIPWPMCPESQYYEYRCYKGCPSIVLLAVASADRKFLYIDVGRPGVYGDSTIYNSCTLKKMIEDKQWLGPNIPDLNIAGIEVRPYLIGDCAFRLDVNMMKSSSKAEMAANPVLKTWDAIASHTRKPIECAFGILKHRFLVLKSGVRLHHEDDIVFLCSAYVIMHNMCIDNDDPGEAFLSQDEEQDEQEIITAETSRGKKQRDALLHYVIEKLYDSN